MNTPIKTTLAAAGVCLSLLTVQAAPVSAQNNDEFTSGQIRDIMFQCIGRGGRVFSGPGGWFTGDWAMCVLPDGTDVNCTPIAGRSNWLCDVIEPEETGAVSGRNTAPAAPGGTTLR